MKIQTALLWVGGGIPASSIPNYKELLFFPLKEGIDCESWIWDLSKGGNSSVLFH